MSRKVSQDDFQLKNNDDRATKKNENENVQDNKHIHIPNNVLMKIHIIPCIKKFYYFVVTLHKK